ncbi:MAG TPA: hypothetical protein VNQ53_14375 [Nocardioides sp.]|nr:hypothetical protein [Nocardioides sp.]
MPTVPPPLVAAVVDGLKQPVLVLDGTVPEAPKPPPPYGSVVLVASDLAALRDAIGGLPDLGRARMVGVVVAEAASPLPLRIRPTWPTLLDLDARLEQRAGVTVAKFASRLDVADVLAGIAYADGRPGHGGLVVARDYDPDAKVPPDVVLGAGSVEESPVLGRPPAVVTDPGPAPLDETLFNPRGFRREWTRGVVDLDPSWTPTPGLIEVLRDAQGVRVPADADPRLVAALAMSGVPLVEPGDEAETPSWLGDPQQREEHSVRQSRAALLEHSTLAWRRRLAERAGVSGPTFPSVTVAPDLTGDLVLVTSTDQPPAPDLVTDLLLARRYSGADLVSAGDTVLADRSLVRRVGTDPAQLIEAVRAAGGTDYRTRH